MSKLYPPQIEGKLPAFYNTYNSNNTKIIETTLKIPFGINRAVDSNSIKNIALRIRTTSTNIDIKTNYLAIQYDSNEGIAIFKFVDQDNNQLFKENQYYRVQLAFVDTNDEIGYYSSVGIIKCVAKPTVEIVNYDLENINMFNGAVGFLGQYKQDTKFGDSTEKEYSYIFNIYDKNNNIVATSGEKIHDITEDNLSNTSKDLWKTYQTFDSGEVYYLQYIVTTINGLVISTIKYKIMEIISSPIEFNIQLHANVDYDNGLIELRLQGDIEDDDDNYYYYQLLNSYHIFNKDIVYFIKENNEYIEFDDTIEKWEQFLNEQKLYMKIKTVYKGEKPCNGQFVITRSSAKTNFMDWVEITRFSLQNQPPSIIYHQDITVEQGIEYKYALQQYNTHGLYSRRQYQTDKNGNFNTIIADFDSIFLTDGTRQLKVYFNPEISSFKNTILEDKIETIGSKYPYIVRNGIVSYKEFPIAGLISYKMDSAKKFLTENELLEAGLLENSIRQSSAASDSFNNTTIRGHEQNIYFEIIENKIRDPYTHKILYTEQQYVMKRKPNIIYSKNNNINSIDNNIDIKNQELDLRYGTVKQSTDLTSDNIKGERYFKLKVLEWLSDGKVKLFRSPTEGNYLVRLVNVSLQPQNTLGRMLHDFNCMAYEIDELTYDNLIKYGIIIEKNISNIEEQWGSIDIKRILQNKDLVFDNDGFTEISPIGISINTILINNFIPGDQIKVVYENGTESNIFTIGATGSLEINKDDRKIAVILIKPNSNNFNSPARELIYSYSGIATNSFNTISKISIITRPSEQFIGPKDDLLSPYDLKANICEEFNNNGQLNYSINNEEDGISNIYNDLINKNHMNYNIGTIKDVSKYKDYNAKKFTVLKIEHLHVWKREIIPIFAYDENITTNTKFGLTPFGKGYVNNQPILNYIDINEYTQDKDIRYSKDNENILEKNENNEWIRSNKVNIEDIETLISNDIHYANDQTLIFQAFIFDTNINDWVPSTIAGFQYYDNFTKKWWDENTEYNASFSINSQVEDLNEDEGIISIGDNTIYLDDINSLTLYDLGLVSQIKLGNGVIAEITPQIRVTTYDIEDSIEEVKNAKEDYENSKKRLFEAIGTSVVDVSSKEELLLQKKKLTQELDTATQKLESLGNTDPFKNVSEIAEERLIQQKQQIWYDRQAEFSEILNFLTNTEIYDKLEASNTVPVCVGLTLTSNKEQVKLYLTELQEKIDKIYSPQQDENGNIIELTENDLFSDTTRGKKIYLHKYPDNFQTIEDIDYNFIDESHYIDLNYYLEQRENNLKIIENYNQQIIELQQQQGELIGDYTSDNYTGVDSLPANTIVYYDYLIKQAQQQQQAELVKVNKTKVALINQLLRVDINKTIDILKGISGSTAEYLQNNAKELLSLLNTYYEDKNRRLLAIQNQCAVDLAKIIFNNQNITIENIDNNMREEIINYILKEDNEKKNNIVTIAADTAVDNTNSKLLNNILNNIININNNEENLTLRDLITLINNLKEVNKGEKEDSTFYLKKFLKKNYENLSVYIDIYDSYALILQVELNALNDKLSELRKIIDFPGDSENSYDIYDTPNYSNLHANFNQAIDNIRTNYVEELQNYINTLLTNNFEKLNNLIFVPSGSEANAEAFALLDLFTNESNRSQATTIKSYLNKYYPADTNELIDELIKQIKNQNALYAKKVSSLDKSILEYTAFKENIQNEIDILQSVIDDLEQKQNIQRKNLEFNNKKIAEAESLKDILDSSEFFNRLINNSEIQDNVTILLNYLTWVEYTEDIILQQAGKMNNSITDENSYINWLKNYIDIYEGEAFDFLHKYNAIKPDLAMGLANQNTDPDFMVGIDKYMYDLNSYKLNVYENILYILDNEVDSDTYNAIMPKISSENKETRLEGYEELLLYLTKIFIGEKDKEKIPITFGITESGKLLSLVSDDTIHESIIYPTAYTIGKDSKILFGINNGRYIDNNSNEKLLRDMTQEQAIFEVQPNEDGQFEDSVYNTSHNYYIHGNNNSYTFLFNSSSMNPETFHQEISKYIEKNQPVYWKGAYPPVSITIDLHPFLYKTDLTDFEIEYDENDENHIILQPTLLNQFKNFLGHIVHYKLEESEEEFGSYYSLLENDLQLFNFISNYFTAKMKILRYEKNDKDVKEINDHIEKNSRYTSSYYYWKKIYNNCEIVLDGYNAEGMSDNDEKKKQLIILLEMAQEKQQYYLDLINKEEEIITQLEEIHDLSGYTMTKKSLNTILQRIDKIKEDFNKNYEVYQERVKHYLNLLFNNIPYGKTINQDIIVNFDILHINNEDTSTYNFGIAYIIEKFQDYMFNNEQFNYEVLNEITQNAKNFKVLLNYNFPLYEIISNPELEYEDKLKNNYYKYEEEEDKYVPYLYIDEEKWINDINQKIVYYVKYLTLGNFINYRDYYKVNDLIDYDMIDQYYILNSQNEYIKYNIENEENFLKMKERLYFKGNGGLKTLLNYIYGSGEYIDDITINYNGTLELIQKLLTQIRGDNISITQLEKVVAITNQQIEEIDILLEKISNVQFNVNDTINNIKRKLAKYLYVLTINYIRHVEGVYDI